MRITSLLYVFTGTDSQKKSCRSTRYGMFQTCTLWKLLLMTGFYCVQTHGREILQLFQDVFSLLPIATIIDGKILIVHGGISDETDLDFLGSIERHKVSFSNCTNNVWPLDVRKKSQHVYTTCHTNAAPNYSTVGGLMSKMGVLVSHHILFVYLK